MAELLRDMMGSPPIEHAVEGTLRMLSQPDSSDPEPWPNSSDEQAYFDELHQHDP